MTDDPGRHLQILRVGGLGDSMVAVVAQIGGNAFHAPQQVCVSIGHVDADASGEVSEISDVRVPGMWYVITVFVGSQKPEDRHPVDAGVVCGQVNLHLKEVGEKRKEGYDLQGLTYPIFQQFKGLKYNEHFLQEKRNFGKIS